MQWKEVRKKKEEKVKEGTKYGIPGMIRGREWGKEREYVQRLCRARRGQLSGVMEGNEENGGERGKGKD